MDALLSMRIACLIVWSIMALLLSPAFARLVRGRYHEVDEWKTAFFFTAILLAGTFAGRVFTPDEHSLFVALNALTLAVAIYVGILIKQGRR